ncbi:unnamed protein product [Ixodes persulcatus]
MIRQLVRHSFRKLAVIIEDLHHKANPTISVCNFQSSPLLPFFLHARHRRFLGLFLIYRHLDHPGFIYTCACLYRGIIAFSVPSVAQCSLYCTRSVADLLGADALKTW